MAVVAGEVRERAGVGDLELDVEVAAAAAARRGDGRGRWVEADDPAAKLLRQVEAVASVAATDVEEVEATADGEAEAGDGQASELARAVAPQLAVARVARVPVRGFRSEGVAVRGRAPVAHGRASGVPAGHACVSRRHASRYFSAVLATTSSGSSGPGAVLSQSSVSR